MTPDDNTPPPKLALRTRDAAKALSISERTLQELTAAGKVPVFKLGRANLYPVKELEEWLTELAMNQKHVQQALQSKERDR